MDIIGPLFGYGDYYNNGLNLLAPYNARVQEVLINNCSIVYDADEEFGPLPIADTNFNVCYFSTLLVNWA